ncbi:hypothetical protein HYX11_03715 [Candidatus Woesearchaeota archaeon]|nr:hypothetical protein [Candidatus Woesearchaeota archaeon]
MPPAYQQTFQKSEQQLASAQYLLNVTYRTIQDPKLLIGVITTLFSSLEHALTAVLIYERSLLLIPAYENNFEKKFTLFRSNSAKRNHLPQKHIELIKKIHSLTELHKTSPVEFQRGNKLILCDKKYQLEPLTLELAQNYVELTHQFLNIIAKIIKIKRKQ